MNRRCPTSAACALLFGLLLAPSVIADFYVSPKGSDAAVGSLEKPFATLEKARDAARASKRSSGDSTEPITVWLRGGDYIRTNALLLTAADSGTEKSPIVWRAHGDEYPRLLGARIL